LPGSRLLRYPGATLSTVLLNLRPDHPEFRSAAVRTALLAAIDRARIIDEAYAGSAATATDPIPAVSPLFDLAADPLVEYNKTAARKALKSADWTEKDDGWYPPGATKPLSIEVLSPEQDANPGLFAAAVAVVRDWEAIGLKVKHVPLPPGEFVSDHLAKGAYQVAVADVAIGLDPDLYPLLASSQTLTGGSNVMGVQDPALDALLAKARAPGTPEVRQAAYTALQQQLGRGRYLLPLAFADEVAVIRDTATGVAVRQVSDPSDRFWDVLTWRLAADR
jgi:peptide/nickel transport system substrate-binding protein